jgi:hypothetical protein
MASRHAPRASDAAVIVMAANGRIRSLTVRILEDLGRGNLNRRNIPNLSSGPHCCQIKIVGRESQLSRLRDIGGRSS